MIVWRIWENLAEVNEAARIAALRQTVEYYTCIESLARGALRAEPPSRSHRGAVTFWAVARNLPVFGQVTNANRPSS